MGIKELMKWTKKENIIQKLGKIKFLKILPLSSQILKIPYFNHHIIITSIKKTVIVKFHYSTTCAKCNFSIGELRLTKWISWPICINMLFLILNLSNALIMEFEIAVHFSLLK